MWKPQSTEGYLASIFFVNEYQLFGFNGISPGSNGPYWSLSFEVTYYLIAGLIIYLSPAWSIPLTLILLTIAGVTISALFPIWALGYFLYFFRINLSKNIYIYVTAILTAILLVLAPKIATQLPSDNWGYYLPWGRGPFNRNIIFDYLVAILFAIHLISVRAILNRVTELTNETAKQYIRAAGLVTFPLYLIHYPILCFASAVSPWSNDSIFNLVYLVVTTIVLVIMTTIMSRYLQDAFKAMLRKPFLP